MNYIITSIQDNLKKRGKKNPLIALTKPFEILEKGLTLDWEQPILIHAL